MSDVVRDVEHEVETGRASNGRRKHSGPPNEVVITLEPTRESWRRNDERCADARNDASTLSEWLFEEAAWLATQLLKVAVSVAAFRGIQQLFRSRLANESAYRRAPDLWSHGHQEGRRDAGRIPPGLSGREALRARWLTGHARLQRPETAPQTTWPQMSRSTSLRSRGITSTSTAGGCMPLSIGPAQYWSRRRAGRAPSSSGTEAGQRNAWRSGR
jgi:hypothetical protein